MAAVLQMLLCFKGGEKEPPTDAQWLADKGRAAACRLSAVTAHPGSLTLHHQQQHGCEGFSLVS